MKTLGKLLFMTLFTCFMLLIFNLIFGKLDTISIIVGMTILTINNLMLKK